MKLYINYTTVSHRGNIREKNQDNFWSMGTFLKSENNGLMEPISGIIDSHHCPAFAIFDGMGGEQQGEVAAYIAARSFNTSYKNNKKKNPKKFLLNACFCMNDAIYRYSQKKHIFSMGSTVAILLFGNDDIFICNVGDSRIYKHRDKMLMQISHDHSDTNVVNRKPPLTQSLGIPESEFVIEPYLANEIYKTGDKYLICSDGLTDMVKETDIGKIIKKYSDLTECAKMLMQKALDAGGNDNITIILCEILKKNQSFNFKNIIKNIVGGTVNEY